MAFWKDGWSAIPCCSMTTTKALAEKAGDLFRDDPRVHEFFLLFTDRMHDLEQTNDELKRRLDEYLPTDERRDRAKGREPKRFFLQLFLDSQACKTWKRGVLNAAEQLLVDVQHHLHLDASVIVAEHKRDGTRSFVHNSSKQGEVYLPSDPIHKVLLLCLYGQR